jgi:hypothetical protein
MMIDKDTKMKYQIPSYEMFTSAGDLAVADLVTFSKIHSLPDTVVLALMSALSKDDRFGEATDTAVRETVGVELGWYK